MEKKKKKEKPLLLKLTYGKWRKSEENEDEEE